MKQLPDALNEHLSGEAITLCNCWRIVRTDGVVLGFADHDRDLVFGGVLHEAATGFTAGETEISAGPASDSQEVAGVLSSERITEADIAARAYDGARVEHYRVNWQDPAVHVLMHTHLLGEVTREDSLFRAELRSLFALTDQTEGRRFDKLCSADLGDGDCGVDLVGALTDSGTVTAVRAPAILEIGGLAHRSAGWFRAGRLTFTSGANAGKPIEIAEHFIHGGLDNRVVVHLWAAPALAVAPGDGFTVTPGCDKRFTTCRGKFANGLNFQGFPHIPGTEFAMRYAANAGRMDGGPIYP